MRPNFSVKSTGVDGDDKFFEGFGKLFLKKFPKVLKEVDYGYKGTENKGC